MMNIEVAYATPSRQMLLSLQCAHPSTARQAISGSGILQHFPELNMADLKIGIFSKSCSLDKILRDGDRVEIYRPLLCDPKEKRRQKQAASRSQ